MYCLPHSPGLARAVARYHRRVGSRRCTVLYCTAFCMVCTAYCVVCNDGVLGGVIPPCMLLVAPPTGRVLYYTSGIFKFLGFEGSGCIIVLHVIDTFEHVLHPLHFTVQVMASCAALYFIVQVLAKLYCCTVFHDVALNCTVLQCAGPDQVPRLLAVLLIVLC